MLTAVTGLARNAKFLLNENSRTILTGVGIVGTVTTTYLTGRATFKAAAIIAEEKEQFNKDTSGTENGQAITDHDLPRWTKIKLVWHHYIPPGVTLVTTITCIIVANKIASRKIAALAIASGVSERALQEYKAKVIEKLGERQDEKIRDEVAQDRVNQHAIGSREIILAGTGEVLCYDLNTGRYFQSTVEEIKRAENAINHDLNNFMHVSASEFYEKIGLDPTSYTDNVGWNANEHIEVIFSSVLRDDKPCLAIDFKKAPFVNYSRHHD